MLNKSDLEKIMNIEFVILYGAGFCGRIYRRILAKEGIDILCYAISDGQISSVSVDHKEIKHLSELNYNKKNTIIILTLDKKYHEEITVNLRKHGYHNIMPCDWNAVYEELNLHFEKIMLQRNVNLENETIDFGLFKMQNPLKTKYKNVFLLEAKELILPYFKDITYISEGTYEFGEVKLKANDVVIDAGANIGMFSAFAAGKGCQVFAFEPVSTTVEVLRETAVIYPENIQLKPYALASKAGDDVIHLAADSGSCTMLDNFIEESSQQVIKTTTIDYFVQEQCLQRVDFIKADIEGAERLMLQGAQETLRRFAPKLAICTYHLPDDKEVLEQLIKQANPDYIVEHKWKKLYAYVPEEKRQDLLQQNENEGQP